MFYDRADAAEKLSQLLKAYQDQKEAIVLAMPRGGVVLGKKISQNLHLPLDIVLSKKIPAPNNPEFAIGAVAESGDPVLNDEIIGSYGITAEYLENEIAKLREEISQRAHLFRAGRKAFNLNNKTVIIIDDGVATGYSLQAAIEHVKAQNPQKIIVAVPVVPADTLQKIQPKISEFITIMTQEEFFSVSQFYEQFEQISDEEVVRLLNH